MCHSQQRRQLLINNRIFSRCLCREINTSVPFKPTCSRVDFANSVVHPVAHVFFFLLVMYSRGCLLCPSRHSTGWLNSSKAPLSVYLYCLSNCETPHEYVQLPREQPNTHLQIWCIKHPKPVNALSQTESIDVLRLHLITPIWTIEKDLVREEAESDSTLEFTIEIKSLVRIFLNIFSQ